MCQQLHRAIHELSRWRLSVRVMVSAALPLLFLAGCSTAPVADFLDYFFPPRMIPGATPYGGVCQPNVVGPAPPGTAQPVVPPPGFPAGPPAAVQPAAPPDATSPAPPPPPPPSPPTTTTLERPVPATPVDNPVPPKS
jgi:hypothetical protein